MPLPSCPKSKKYIPHNRPIVLVDGKLKRWYHRLHIDVSSTAEMWEYPLPIRLPRKVYIRVEIDEEEFHGDIMTIDVRNSGRYIYHMDNINET